MKLTAETLQHCVGGTLEIKNKRKGYFYRGKVGKVQLSELELTIHFKELFSFVDGAWCEIKPRPYVINLSTYSADWKDGKMNLQGVLTEETAVLFSEGDNHELYSNE